MESVRTEDEHAVTVYWYKNQKPRRINICRARDWLKAEASRIRVSSILLFWNLESGKENMKPPTPSLQDFQFEPPSVIPRRSIGVQTEKFDDPDLPIPQTPDDLLNQQLKEWNGGPITGQTLN